MQLFKEKVVSVLSLFCGFTGRFYCLSHLGSLMQLSLAICLAWTEGSEMGSPQVWNVGLDQQGAPFLCAVSFLTSLDLSYVNVQQKLKLQCFLLWVCYKFHNVPPTTLLVKSSHKANRDFDYILTGLTMSQSKKAMWNGRVVVSSS